MRAVLVSLVVFLAATSASATPSANWPPIPGKQLDINDSSFGVKGVVTVKSCDAAGCQVALKSGKVLSLPKQVILKAKPVN